MADRTEQRLPQTGPARLITEVLELSPDSLRCRARVPPGSPFCGRKHASGRASALIAIEMGAQASALLPRAHRPDDDEQPLQGVLASVRNVRLHVDEVDAEAEYLVETHLVTDVPPLRIAAFVVRCGDRVVAEGKVTTAETD